MVTATSNTLKGQMDNIRDNITKEKKMWIQKHEGMMQAETSINWHTEMQLTYWSDILDVIMINFNQFR